MIETGSVSGWQGLFKTAAQPAARGKFLSRLFGIFSEEIVAMWATDGRAPYENLGRPTIRTMGESRGHTLDFTFRERSSGRVFVAEMKCEIEFQRFRYFVLERVEQLAHHGKPAFAALLAAARRSSEQTVHIRGTPVAVEGAILVWGAATSEGRQTVRDAHGFHDVLTIENICSDLAAWKHEGYFTLLSERQQWCSELFSGLRAGGAALSTPGLDRDGKS